MWAPLGGAYGPRRRWLGASATLVPTVAAGELWRGQSVLTTYRLIRDSAPGLLIGTSAFSSIGSRLIHRVSKSCPRSCARFLGPFFADPLSPKDLYFVQAQHYATLPGSWPRSSTPIGPGLRRRQSCSILHIYPTPHHLVEASYAYNPQNRRRDALLCITSR